MGAPATARTYGKRGPAFLAWFAQHRHLPRLHRACLEDYRADLDRRRGAVVPEIVLEIDLALG